MFDLRYHVASLAAVFLALIIGILVGIGISGRGFVDKSERNKLNARIAALQGRIDAEQERVDELTVQQKAALTFIEDAYPALMHDRLRGKRVALVFVGSIDAEIREDVQTALADSNARPILRVRAVKVPIDAESLDAELATRAAFTRYLGDDQLGRLGRALGQELVKGGQTPLWDLLSDQLVEERLGGARRTAEGVVVVRSAPPQQAETASFLRGFYAGLNSAGAPAVGVGPSGVDGDSSAVKAFARAGLASVDDIDTETGRLALALLLAGAEKGQYGLEGEDGILPPIEPLPAETAQGG